MELETINKLYLELSQIATAKTARELELERGIGDARSRALELCYKIEELPAGEGQTDCSVAASDLQSRLSSLLPFKPTSQASLQSVISSL